MAKNPASSKFEPGDGGVDNRVPRIVVDERAKTLTIVVPLENPRSSKSGKNLLIATGRFQDGSTGVYDDREVTVQLNAWVKPTQA